MNSGGGLFNQAGTASTNTFGQPQNQPQTSQFGGFGAQSGSSTGGLFGAQKPAASTGGLFGSAPNPGQTFGQGSSSAPTTPSVPQFGGNSTTNNPPSTSLFGSKPATSTPVAASTGLFGNTSTAATQPSSGLFGQTNSAAPSTTGLFGTTAPTQPSTTGSSLFGGASNTTPATTSLFGNTSTAQAPAQGTSLFGNTASAANTTGTSLFGKPAAPPTGGLFGSAANNTVPGTTTIGASSTPNTSLFGKPATSGAQPTTGVSVFGGQSFTSQPSSSGSTLFGKQPNASVQGSAPLFGAANAANGSTAGRLFATIEQPSYSFPGQQANAGSPKLYKSLTSGFTQPQKDNLRSAPVNKLVAPVKPVLNVQKTNPSPTTKASETRQQETRKLINSYDKYVQERPTNLVIRRAKRPALALPSSSRRAIDNNPGSETSTREKPVNGNLETSAPSETLADSTIPSVDISLFHKQSQNVTLVKVNKAALEQGYFIRPGLDELASLSKSQLRSVKNLVIGRDTFGQLSYSEPVDLSEIENLGDILGKLVIFDRGTVCVYPDDGVKAERGKELNVPCTVTIENAFPLDSEGRSIISMADPRVAKHVARLRKANEAQGAEFITFSHGVWVFKVPHFSVWGIPADEMVVDDGPEDSDLFDEDMGIEVNGVSNIPRSKFASLAAAVEKPPQIRSKPRHASPAPNLQGQSPFFPRTSTPDAVQADADLPDASPVQAVTKTTQNRWTDILTTSHILAASEDTLAGVSGIEGTMKTSDLTKILFGSRNTNASSYEELRRPQKCFAPKPLLTRGNTPSGVRKARVSPTNFDASSLRSFLVKSQRSAQGGGLSRFTTKVTFTELQRIAPNPLWPICSVVFDGDAAISRRQRLSAWITEQTKAAVNRDLASASNDFDAIWVLICGHRLEDAAVRAISSENPHLATVISQLGSPVVRKAAQAQLDDWKSSDAIFYIPTKIRAIYELAAGNTGLVPPFSANGRQSPEINLAEGLDWKRVLGLKLWYGLNDVSIENIIATLPDSDDPEFVFLRLVCQPSVLNQIEALVDLPTAFLALQALKSVPQGPEVIDRVCVQLAYDLLSSSQLSSAVFVALHIVTDGLALTVVKDLLMRSPWSLSSTFVNEMSLPSSIVLESRALYSHYSQQYLAEANLLLEAGLAQECHQVLVSEVAPQAVLNGNLETIVDLLQKIPTTVKGWNLGGKVYLDFAKFLLQPSSQLALSLASALESVPTPKVEIKAAVAIMSGLVAKQGRSSLSTGQILSMKLSSSLYRLQAMQQSATDLIGV